MNNEKRELLELLEEKARRKKYNLISTYYTDTGTNARSLYPKHMDFMESGAHYTQRAFIAANRVGKTLTGGIELTYHLTGRYPDWWKGKKFSQPIKAWVSSITPSQMKDAVQSILFGSFADKGTGLIPKEDLVGDDGQLRTWNMPGTSNVIGTCLVRHYDEHGIMDGWSHVEFKTYEQGWEKFQGAKVDLVWLDEEPKDRKIYTECITRTSGQKGNTGIIYCTFTPLLGFSETVLSFLPGGKLPPNGVNPLKPYKKVIAAGWDDVPHLDEEWKQQALSEYPYSERDARTKGIPTKGSGAIYPVAEEDIVVEPFNPPGFWTKAYGLDFGWTHPTAVVWGVQDPVSKVIYLCSEHKLARSTPPIHAAAIKERGTELIGACDPAGGGSSQRDGTTLIDEYLLLGLNITPSKGGPNSKEPRISKVLTMLETGQLKVFSTLQKWIDEYRIYRRDEAGKIVKDNDDLMDATQYLITEWNNIALNPLEEDEEDSSSRYGASKITGY